MLVIFACFLSSTDFFLEINLFENLMRWFNLSVCLSVRSPVRPPVCLSKKRRLEFFLYYFILVLAHFQARQHEDYFLPRVVHGLITLPNNVTRVCSRPLKQKTFKDAVFAGALRVNIQNIVSHMSSKL